MLRHEAQMLTSLLLLVRRRQHAVPAGAVAIGYDKALRPIGMALLGLSVLELVAIELALPWPTVRLVLFVLGAYTLLFVLGMIAANHVRPHVLTAQQLRLRSGTWADIRIPLVPGAHVTTRHRDAGTKTVTVDGDVLAMGVGGMTNVEIAFGEPIEVDTRRGTHTVRMVRFAADDPQAAVRALRQHTAAPPVR